MTFAVLIPFFRETLALHVISVILWMAGMLTLPWLFAEHATLSPRSTEHEVLVGIERRLMRLAINPLMFAAWGFGILLILTPGAISWSAGWWQTKFAAVLVLSGYHGLLSVWRRRFRTARNVRGAAYYRAWALTPIVLAILIVVMVITQPQFSY